MDATPRKNTNETWAEYRRMHADKLPHYIDAMLEEAAEAAEASAEAAEAAAEAAEAACLADQLYYAKCLIDKIEELCAHRRCGLSKAIRFELDQSDWER